jgi:hypothetical protein
MDEFDYTLVDSCYHGLVPKHFFLYMYNVILDEIPCDLVKFTWEPIRTRFFIIDHLVKSYINLVKGFSHDLLCSYETIVNTTYRNILVISWLSFMSP